MYKARSMRKDRILQESNKEKEKNVSSFQGMDATIKKNYRKIKKKNEIYISTRKKNASLI